MGVYWGAQGALPPDTRLSLSPLIPERMRKDVALRLASKIPLYKHCFIVTFACSFASMLVLYCGGEEPYRLGYVFLDCQELLLQFLTYASRYIDWVLQEMQQREGRQKD